MPTRRNKPVPEEDLEEIRQWEIRNNAVLTSIPRSSSLPQAKERRPHTCTRDHCPGPGRPAGQPNSPEHNQAISEGQREYWRSQQEDELGEVIDDWEAVAELLYFGLLEMTDQIREGAALSRAQRDLKNSIIRTRNEANR
jgi:hypothetical protein